MEEGVDKVIGLLRRFEPISLEETNATASLLSRVDTKFVIRPDQLPSLLLLWESTHRVLEVKGARMTHYQSVYYDTPGFDLYHAHHSGKANRVKVRTRQYADQKVFYYEVKQRDNHGITDKKRVALQDSSQVKTLMGALPEQHPGAVRTDRLQAVLLVAYDRITLVSKQQGERITIDSHLAYRAGERAIDFPDRVIIEVKHAKADRSGVLQQFRRLGLKSGSISKYCLGMIHLYPTIKQNHFKQPLRILAKQLRNDGAVASAR